MDTELRNGQRITVTDDCRQAAQRAGQPDRTGWFIGLDPTMENRAVVIWDGHRAVSTIHVGNLVPLTELSDEQIAEALRRFQQSAQ